MAGNTTGFQKTFTFEANATHTTVGTDQAVVYGTSEKQVQVPETDNLVAVGVVTYQEEARDGAHVAVQLDRIAEIIAAEPIAFGDDIVVAAGGKAKKADAFIVAGANVLGEAQNSALEGEKVQVLIRPKFVK